MFCSQNLLGFPELPATSIRDAVRDNCKRRSSDGGCLVPKRKTDTIQRRCPEKQALLLTTGAPLLPTPHCASGPAILGTPPGRARRGHGPGTVFLAAPPQNSNPRPRPVPSPQGRLSRWHPAGLSHWYPAGLSHWHPAGLSRLPSWCEASAPRWTKGRGDLGAVRAGSRCPV